MSGGANKISPSTTPKESCAPGSSSTGGLQTSMAKNASDQQPSALNGRPSRQAASTVSAMTVARTAAAGEPVSRQ